jgi:hypothetical protein
MNHQITNQQISLIFFILITLIIVIIVGFILLSVIHGTDYFMFGVMYSPCKITKYLIIF